MGLKYVTLIIIAWGFVSPPVLTYPTGTTENIELKTEWPVFYEVATEEITGIAERAETESALEDTTTLSPATENPKNEEELSPSPTKVPQLQFTHPDQEEIMDELHNIWYFSEGLNEDQNDLKSSLSSLVHMTYARVYDQQDETLSRLKYLLRKLRTRLLDEDTSSGDLTTTEISVTTQLSDTETPNSQAMVMRKKRSPIDSADTNNILANADPDDNTLYTSLSSEQKSQEPIVNQILTIGPDQKVLQPEINEILPMNPIPSTTNEENDSEITEIPSIPTTYPENITTMIVKDSETADGIKSEKIPLLEHDKNKKPVTVEEIINKIISVLQSPMKMKTPTQNASEDIQHQTSILIKLKPLKSGVAMNYNEKINDIPSYLTKFMGVTNSTEFYNFQSPITNVSNSTEFPSLHSDTNELLEKEYSISTESNASNISLFQEINSTQILTTPTKFLGGTMAGMLAFINVLDSLSNTSRLIIIFVITALILSVALGFNSSLGPPIAVLGSLAFIIPIFILLYFQTNQRKLKSGVKDSIWNRVSVEEINRVLELLDDAISMYQ